MDSTSHYTPMFLISICSLIRSIRRGIDLDAYKRIFDASPNSTLEDIVYFKGADTTRYNSKLRSYIVNELPKMIGKEHTDLAIVDGFTQFDPLYTDGQGKRYLLDLPDYFLGVLD